MSDKKDIEGLTTAVHAIPDDSASGGLRGGEKPQVGDDEFGELPRSF